MPLRFVEAYDKPEPHKLWASDFQPHEMKGVIGNEMIVETLDTYLKSRTVPNLILCGPNGCGKSTVAKILVKKYLGKFHKYCNLDVIGSIHRGKNVVSEKNDKKKNTDKLVDGPNIVNFIRKCIRMPDDMYKIVTIYDFDCMTSEAQMALRRIIELYADKVRFILICNDLNSVIEAIQSRALVLKFNQISVEDIKSRLVQIANANNTSFTDEIYDSIAIMSNGDLKQAINYLQVFSSCSDKNLDNFYYIFNIPAIHTVKQMIKYCIDKNGQPAFETLMNLINNGYNVSDILDVIIKVLSYSEEITDEQRVVFITETTRVFCLNEVSPSNTHLYNLVVHFIQKS
jgi:DNA polymerase III delta prime subunit